MADDRIQYPAGLQWLAEGGNLTTAAQLEVALIGQGSDVPTLTTASFVADFDSGTLIESDAVGYVRKVLSGVVGTIDDSEQWITYVHDQIDWTPLLGPGSLAIIGALYFVKVTNDADSIPLSFNDRGGFPKIPNAQPYALKNPNGFFRLGSRPLSSLTPGL